MSKIISFSLWGSKKIYFNGAYLNIQEAKEIYPGWICRFYCDNSVPKEVLSKIVGMGGEVLTVSKKNDWSGLFWRFLAMEDRGVDVVIIRDTDSIVSHREKAAVDEWLASGYVAHGIRDSIMHNVPMMGGLFGVKNPYSNLYNVNKNIQAWQESHKMEKGTDQEFLSEKIWPLLRDKILVHDKYNGRAFKLPSGEILTMEDVIYYNKWQGVEADYPDGRIEFKKYGSFQRLDVYEYDAISYFGKHEIRKFPLHKPFKYGTFCGEDIKSLNN